MGQEGTSTTAETPAAGRAGLLAIPALAFGAVMLGASPIFVRLAEVGPFTSAFWRMALAIPFLWIWLKIEDRRENRMSGWRVAAREYRAILALGFLFAGDLFFWHLAIVNTSVANATLLATMMPIIVTLGAWLLLKELINARILAGVALGIAGAALLVGASARFEPENVIGDVHGVITAFFFGGYVLAMAAARRKLSTAMLMFWPALVTAALLLVPALAFEDRMLPPAWQGAGALAGLAVLSHVGGQGLVAYALGFLPAIFSSLVIFLEAVAAAVMAWLLFAEALSLWQALGGLLILAGIYAARPSRKPAPPPARTS